MFSVDKPILIIGCSGKKKDITTTAFNLYEGVLYNLIRSNIQNVHEHFEVIILSAEHGLISGHKSLSPYESPMPNMKNAENLTRFVDEHKKEAYKLLSQFKSKNRKVYIALTNEYLTALDAMFSATNFDKLLRSFHCVYTSRNHVGIGVVLGRLKKIISLVTNAEALPTPVLFRSGLANADEFVGFINSKPDIGTSLAYVSDIKSPHLLQYMIQSLKLGNKVFLDNGLITALGSGLKLDNDDVFNRFIAIVKSLKLSLSKNLSLVIPDDPFSPENSVEIVRKYAQEIKWLSTRCNVNLPIHRAADIQEHAHNLLKELKFNTNITVGIPCKAHINKVPVRLNISDIQLLFELRQKLKPKNGKAQRGKLLFHSAHFLGLSEVSPGTIYQERVDLANMHNIEMSCDACRLRAIFGAEETSGRKGSVMSRKVHSELKEINTKTSNYFFNYDREHEFDEPVIHEHLLSEFEKDTNAFVKTWNTVMGTNWTIDVSCMDFADAYSYFEELLNSLPGIIENEFISKWKNHYWKQFTTSKHNPSSFVKRSESVSRLFTVGDCDGVQLNMAF